MADPVDGHNHGAWIASEGFAGLLGTELVEQETDRVLVRLPYRDDLGVERIHGGAISALVDIAATAAFWSHPTAVSGSTGATVGFTIHFEQLAIGTDLFAEAVVRRRGGRLCTGDVIVRNPLGAEIAVARVTYTMKRPRG